MDQAGVEMGDLYLHVWVSRVQGEQGRVSYVAKIAFQSHAFYSFTAEAEFSSHQEVVRLCSPPEARRSRTWEVHRLCGEPVEP
jgi:hypothetical protein